MAQHLSVGDEDEKALAATKKEVSSPRIDRSQPPQNQPGSIRIVFHCTKRENVDNILKTGFRFPTVDDAIARGLKLGAAVYFGTNVEYCFREAVNTLLEETGLPDSLENRARLQQDLGCLKVYVASKRPLSFGNYKEGQQGQTIWPLACLPLRKEGPLCLLLTGKPCSPTKPLTSAEWDDNTERISCKYLARYGFDTATINEGTPAEELAVYAPDSIIRVEPVDASMRQFCHL